MSPTHPKRFNIHDIKHATKIKTAFMLVAVMVLCVGGLGLWGMGQVSAGASHQATTDIYNRMLWLLGSAIVVTMEEGVQQVVANVERVANAERAAREMAEGVQRVNTAITTVASVSEENSAAAEQISAATEQMTAQVSEMSASTDTIKAIAQSLHEAARVFHWDYADNWRARGMRPSNDPPLWHPVPARHGEADDEFTGMAA